MKDRPLKVLVVSENRPMLRHMSQFLNVFGYEPRQAADVQQALVAIESDWPDFLIIDADLADHGGLQLCRTVEGQQGQDYVYTFLMVGESGSAHADRGAGGER